MAIHVKPLTEFEHQMLIDQGLILAAVGFLLSQNASSHARELSQACMKRVEALRSILTIDNAVRKVIG